MVSLARQEVTRTSLPWKGEAAPAASGITNEPNHIVDAGRPRTATHMSNTGIYGTFTIGRIQGSSCSCCSPITDASAKSVSNERCAISCSSSLWPAMVTPSCAFHKPMPSFGGRSPTQTRGSGTFLRSSLLLGRWDVPCQVLACVAPGTKRLRGLRSVRTRGWLHKTRVRQ